MGWISGTGAGHLLARLGSIRKGHRVENQEKAIATTGAVENEFERPAVVSNVSGNLATEQSRAAAEVLGAIHAAKRFPRDPFTAFNAIMKECQRFGLAEVASYSFPRGGQTVSGPSIRMAEVLARQWGNIDCGIRELEQREGESVMQAYAWDLETNYRVTKNFTVRHIRDTKRGSYKLEDQRDIYEATANQGARRLRACILAVIPGDVTEAAEEQVRKTIARGPNNMTRDDRIRNMVSNFDKLGIPKMAIEKKLGHSVAAISDPELVDLHGIYNSIKDNISRRSDFFDLAESQTEATKDLNERIKAEAKK